MPLQIRRGTEIERQAMAQPLASGELLYITDDQRLYIGNGSTLGGVAITGYTNENAQDAVAPMFTHAGHSGISFVYNDASNIVTATLDLSNYQGTVNAASFKGTLVADDSTPLVDAIDGKIFLDGTVKGNIVPDANETYDIGSASFRFRDLYLSGSSIKLGNATINAVGSAVNLPVGSTIGGEPLNAPSQLTEISANVIADDSTVIVNTTTKVVTAGGGFVGNLTGNISGNVTGNLTGFVLGDVKGSIFADDSTLLVDGVSASINTSGLNISGNRIASNSGNALVLDSKLIAGLPIQFYMAGSTGLNSPTLSVYSSLGSTESPTDHSAGDEINTMQFSGHLNGSYKEAVSWTATWGAAADPLSATPDSILTIATRNNTNGFNALQFNHLGVLSAPIFKAASYTTVNLPSAGAGDAGFIVFDSTSSQFKGWNGAAWVVLG